MDKVCLDWIEWHLCHSSTRSMYFDSITWCALLNRPKFLFFDINEDNQIDIFSLWKTIGLCPAVVCYLEAQLELMSRPMSLYYWARMITMMNVQLIMSRSHMYNSALCIGWTLYLTVEGRRKTGEEERNEVGQATIQVFHHVVTFLIVYLYKGIRPFKKEAKSDPTLDIRWRIWNKFRREGGARLSPQGEFSSCISVHSIVYGVRQVPFQACRLFSAQCCRSSSVIILRNMM